MAIFVSKQHHCLYDILSRCQSGEWQVEIPLIISNHPDLELVAKRFNIDYHIISITKANKQAMEQKELELLKEYRIDFIVLARYMQILTWEFIAHYPNRIINIHHSFLPAFPGAKPYHSAFERGVKIIGATSHYVTAELDAGPIIEQDIVRVNHRDSVEDMIRKGRDLEKLVLSRAIWYHINRKIIVHGNRTLVTD
jgi:formyltetrahydrofolate deformylase